MKEKAVAYFNSRLTTTTRKLRLAGVQPQDLPNTSLKYYRYTACPLSGGTAPRIHSPEHPLAAVVLDDLVLNVDLVAVALSDGQHGVFAARDLPMLYPVITRDVPRVDAGVVGRLDSAGTGVAALKHSVTVRPGN